jgi:hypothetical protein
LAAKQAASACRKQVNRCILIFRFFSPSASKDEASFHYQKHHMTQQVSEPINTDRNWLIAATSLPLDRTGGKKQRVSIIMGLGLGCFGATVAAGGTKVSPAARQSGEGPEFKEKVQKGGGESKQKQLTEKEKRDRQKAAIVINHQFPFHSRPGLL